MQIEMGVDLEILLDQQRAELEALEKEDQLELERKQARACVC